MVNNNDDVLLSLLGLLALASIPLWLPALVGTKPEYCECGVKIEPSGISPGCRCHY